MKKIKVKPEGRKNIFIPEKESLKDFIKERKLKKIHNIIPNGYVFLGADHSLKSVLKEIDKAERLAVFTDETENMGHSLALISENQLECYDIGKITEEDLILSKNTQP